MSAHCRPPFARRRLFERRNLSEISIYCRRYPGLKCFRRQDYIYQKLHQTVKNILSHDGFTSGNKDQVAFGRHVTDLPIDDCQTCKSLLEKRKSVTGLYYALGGTQAFDTRLSLSIVSSRKRGNSRGNLSDSFRNNSSCSMSSFSHASWSTVMIFS